MKKDLMLICECIFGQMKKGNTVYNEEGEKLQLIEDVDPFTMIAFCDDNKVYEFGTLYVCLSE